MLVKGYKIGGVCKIGKLRDLMYNSWTKVDKIVLQ